MEARLHSGQHHRQVHTETRVGAEVIVTRVVYWAFGVLESLLAVRFLLKLLGANAQAAFTDFIYRISEGFVDPFQAVFPTQAVQGAVFEWTTLLAFVVYALIAWGITALIAAASPREHVATIEETRQADDTHTDEHV